MGTTTERPGDSNRRAHPRVELLAQVQVRRELEVHIMPTRDISLGGLFLLGNPSDYPELTVGADVELVIFDVEDPGEADVSLSARVVRHSKGGGPRPGGIGLQFTKTEPQMLRAIQRLIRSANS